MAKLDTKSPDTDITGYQQQFKVLSQIHAWSDFQCEAWG